MQCPTRTHPLCGLYLHFDMCNWFPEILKKIILTKTVDLTVEETHFKKITC